jgi:hypothetical protein
MSFYYYKILISSGESINKSINNLNIIYNRKIKFREELGLTYLLSR